MKFILIIIAMQTLIINKCGQNKLPVSTNDSIPLCIRQQVETIKKEPVWNPPAQVDEYRYNDKQVFLFSSNCCDQYNMLYDNQCKIICAPSGGITGKGDGKCTEFSATAKHIRLIWKDSR